MKFIRWARCWFIWYAHRRPLNALCPTCREMGMHRKEQP